MRMIIIFVTFSLNKKIKNSVFGVCVLISTKDYGCPACSRISRGASSGQGSCVWKLSVLEDYPLLSGNSFFCVIRRKQFLSEMLSTV